MKTTELRKLIREELKSVLEAQEQPKYKVGDRVKVLLGPMKQYPHEVIAVIADLDGTLTYNIQPILSLPGSKNLYHLGAAGAKANQLELVK